MISKGKPLMYVYIQKALYGLLQITIFFYRKLVKDLEANIFQLNPHTPCIENKAVN